MLGLQATDWRPVGGGCIGDGARVTLDDGRRVFVKTMPDPPDGIFAAEARGLRWLGETDTVAVPAVLAADREGIVLDWVEPGRPSIEAARRLGRELAALHLTGARAYGAPWSGWIGSTAMDNGPASSWPEFYAERRLLPTAALARDRGGLDASDLRAVEQVAASLADLAGPAEPPARLHGDLWDGNLHWSADGRCRVIDPAAHGGHRETDLAMLALFGAPHLDALLRAYAEESSDRGRPLADGWHDRVPLHQLWPLLVHAALFGGGYGARAGGAARAALRRS
ncbi:MAG: phosphotransferase [Streptosporangiales bacterium]|nr:phosphotransferase [Streptosporangiales bacterium]